MDEMHATEDELLAAIGKVLSGAGPEVVVGPGDDAAILRSWPGQTVLTTAALADGGGLARAGTRPASDLDRALLRAHFRPVARVGEASVLSRHGVTSMMDVSDGLALDVARLCRSSGVGVVIDRVDEPVAVGAT